MTNTTATEGRRRLDTASIEARPASTFGNDFPEHAPQPATAPRPMLEDSLGYTDDRLDRLEHLLGSLNATVMRAGSVLEPLLTDGSYIEPEANPATDVEPDQRRSTIAKRVARIGHRADNLADATSYIERRVEAILDALEIG